MASVEEFKQRNYYQRLGVSSEATLDEIKEAYRDIARVYHPDSKFYGDLVRIELTSDDEAIFQMVTAAYNTLIREDSRRTYDDKLRRGTDGSIGSTVKRQPPVRGTKEWDATQLRKTPTAQFTKVKIRTIEPDPVGAPSEGAPPPQVTHFREWQQNTTVAQSGELEPAASGSNLRLIIGSLFMAAVVSGATLLIFKH